jgi:hypothetical protein
LGEASGISLVVKFVFVETITLVTPAGATHEPDVIVVVLNPDIY